MFVDSNNLALGIENVQKAMSSYYLIGYYSPITTKKMASIATLTSS